jgi:1,4-dihydroxy-2-naphthoyl-CoA hydrolase
MNIWKRDTQPSEINKLMVGTMCEFVGMEITEIGPDYITATMPVDARTRQHMGIIHGGASVVLAETIGSLGAMLCCPEGFHIVGLDINANHIRAGHPPHVIGTARPLHIGSSTMVWDIRITDIEGKLVCISRLTCAVLEDR